MSEAANKDAEVRPRQEHGWFGAKPHSYAELLKHPIVASWIERYHKGESQESYARALERILDNAGMSVDELLALPSNEAKKTIFAIADAEKKRGKHAQAKKTVIAAKGFFEANKRKFELERHEKKRYYSIPRKKIIEEIIPNKDQVYRMADASLSLKAGLRNKAMILCLFQSGVRPGCLCRWTYRLIGNQLYPEMKIPIKLVITSETDAKLESYGLEYYVTFLQRDAAEALRAYLDNRIHRGWTPKDDDPIFVTESTASRGEPLETGNIWEVIKEVAPAAGIDSRGMWSRLLRKAFRKVLNQSDIDEDTKEAIMGHKLPGSRGNYFDSHDHDEIAAKYMRCQFDRSGPGTSEEAAKRAVIAMMKVQYGDRITADKMKEIERILPMTVSADDMARMMTEIILGKDEMETHAQKPKKTATNGGTPLFETRIMSDEEELMRLLNEGWDVIRELADGRMIIRRPNHFDE